MKTIYTQSQNGTVVRRLYPTDLFQGLVNWSLPESHVGPRPQSWTPSMDVLDEKDAFVISLEAPGMKKEDFIISWHDGVLTISGEKKEDPTTSEKNYLRRESSVGKFTRSVEMSSSIRPEGISASYREGVLLVTLPKAEEAKPRVIDIVAS